MMRMEVFEFIKEGQDPNIVEKVLRHIEQFLEKEERVLYVAVQKKPLLNLNPDCVVISSSRIYLFEFKGWGKTLQMELFNWEEITSLNLSQDRNGYSLTVVPIYDTEFVVESIPPVQAEFLFMEAEKFWKSPSLPIPLEIQTLQEHPEAPQEEPQDQDKEQQEPRHLSKLRSLFERQRITRNEYERLKRKYLEQQNTTLEKS